MLCGTPLSFIELARIGIDHIVIFMLESIVVG